MQSLESILGSRSKIKLLRFLSHNKGWQFNLSEISRIIKVDKGALSRLIKEFEQKKVIETRRSGKLLMFKLNEKNKILMKVVLLFGEDEE